MNKNLLLYILLGFLLIMNGFFLFNHFKKPNRGRPQIHAKANFIADELAFNRAQLQKFNELDQAHRKKIRQTRDTAKSYKNKLFAMIFDKSSHESEIEAVAIKIASMEKVKAMETYRFFRAVHELCDENQKEQLSKIVKDGLRHQGPPNHEGPPGGAVQERRPPPPRD